MLEHEMRRPEFVDGTPVMLADGQAWEFRRPIVRFRRANTPSGFEQRLALGDDGKFGDLIAERARAKEASDDDAFLRAELGLGHLLLTVNYDLTDDQANDLIVFAYGDDGDDMGCRIRNEVIAVALGQGPKQ